MTRLGQVLIGFGILSCALLCIAGDIAWIEVKSPNFIVIGNASQKQAERTARSLEQFRSLLKTALPKLKMDSGYPLTAFALKDEKSYRALLPANVLVKGAATPGGLFISGPERYFVLLQANAPSEPGYHAVYHEYVHMILRLNYPDLPLWLTEGLAEFFGYSRVSNGKSELGIPSPEMLASLKNSTMIPLDTLLGITRDSPYYRDRNKVEMFYSQSWALTHYIMVGDNKAHAGQLSEFLRLLQEEVPEKEAAALAFGNLKDLERNLALYIRSMVFYHYQIPLQLGAKEEQYPVRRLSAAESLARQGEVLVYVGRLDEARGFLEHALQLNRNSALANEGMGMLYSRLEDPDKAGKYFAAAADLDSDSCLANYYAAHSAYERGDTKLVEGYLRKALRINPNFVPAISILSEHLAAQQESLPEALELSQKAASLEPADMSHRIRIAAILFGMGRDDEAAAYAEKVLATARKESDRNEAQALLSRIQGHRLRTMGGIGGQER